jgi:hypothetical protein
MRQHDAAAGAEQRDFEKFPEQRAEGSARRRFCRGDG